MKNKIKFNDDYPKLFGQRKARLMYVEIVHRLQLTKSYIEYDCKKSDGTYFKLNKPKYIRLLFIGEDGIAFQTLRDIEKIDKYVSGLLQEFDLVIEDIKDK